MRSSRAPTLVLVLALVLGGCAKPSELANRTCFPTATWSGPAYSCVTGVPASSSSSSSSSSSESETTAESEPTAEAGGGGEIEMGGDPAPEDDGKGKGKSKAELKKEREAEKAAQKEREREEREEREKEKEAAKQKEREEKEAAKEAAKEKEREKEKEKEKEKVADSDDGEGEGDGDAGKGGKLVSRDGDEIRLDKKIIFKKDSEELSTKSKPLLDELVNFLADHDEIKKVEIAGYTDNKGDKEELKKLSSDRAKAVKDYLVDHGIKSKRLTAKGYGSADPIASNKTKSGRNKNRRIEFHIKKK